MGLMFVGGGPFRVYPAVIVTVAAPLVYVSVTDDANVDGSIDDPIPATGTGTVGDKVNVMIQPTGRAILIRS